MKIIDLLNMIHNKEQTPEKVIFGGIIYTKATDYNTKEVIDYLNHNESLFQINDGFEYCFINVYLNQEIEIIEEDKKIEKLEEPTPSMATYDYVKKLKHKLDEIIDYINKEKE